MEKRNLFSLYILDTSELEPLLRPSPEGISILCRSCDITDCCAPLPEFVVQLDLQWDLEFRISSKFPENTAVAGSCTALAESLI